MPPRGGEQPGGLPRVRVGRLAKQIGAAFERCVGRRVRNSTQRVQRPPECGGGHGFIAPPVQRYPDQTGETFGVLRLDSRGVGDGERREDGQWVASRWVRGGAFADTRGVVSNVEPPFGGGQFGSQCARPFLRVSHLYVRHARVDERPGLVADGGSTDQVGERSGGVPPDRRERVVDAAFREQGAQGRYTGGRRGLGEVAIQSSTGYQSGSPGAGGVMIRASVRTRRTRRSSTVVSRTCRPGVSAHSRCSAVRRAVGSSSCTSSAFGLRQPVQPGCNHAEYAFEPSNTLGEGWRVRRHAWRCQQCRAAVRRRPVRIAVCSPVPSRLAFVRAPRPALRAHGCLTARAGDRVQCVEQRPGDAALAAMRYN